MKANIIYIYIPSIFIHNILFAFTSSTPSMKVFYFLSPSRQLMCIQGAQKARDNKEQTYL